VTRQVPDCQTAHILTKFLIGNFCYFAANHHRMCICQVFLFHHGKRLAFSIVGRLMDFPSEYIAINHLYDTSSNFWNIRISGVLASRLKEVTACRHNIYLTNATVPTFVHSIFDSGCYQCGFQLTENCHILLS